MKLRIMDSLREVEIGTGSSSGRKRGDVHPDFHFGGASAFVLPALISGLKERRVLRENSFSKSNLFHLRRCLFVTRGNYIAVSAMRKSVMSATTSNQSSKFIAEGVQEKLTNIKGYIAGTKHVGSTVLAAMAKQGMFHLVIISALMQAFSAENSTTLLPFWKIFQELRRLTQGRIFIEMLQLANHSADAEDWLLSVGDNLASLELSQIHHSVKALRSKLSTESKLLLGKAILHLYVPTARRLKLMSMVEQLEEAALEFIDPQGFQKVKSMVATAVENGQLVLEDTMQAMEEIVSDLPVKVAVSGRIKSAASVYLKMKAKNKAFSDIRDLLAVRLVLQSRSKENPHTIEEANLCNDALALVRTTWSTVEAYTKDYIRFPKNNGYRGLHTAVDLGDAVVEVQIRTKEMHEAAENGDAAHWRYKARKNPFQ